MEQWRGGKVRKIRPHVMHLMRGQAFELQGCTFFAMGGAQSHDIANGILDMDSPFVFLRRPLSETAPFYPANIFVLIL